MGERLPRRHWPGLALMAVAGLAVVLWTMPGAALATGLRLAEVSSVTTLPPVPFSSVAGTMPPLVWDGPNHIYDSYAYYTMWAERGQTVLIKVSSRTPETDFYGFYQLRGWWVGEGLVGGEGVFLASKSGYYDLELDQDSQTDGAVPATYTISTTTIAPISHRPVRFVVPTHVQHSRRFQMSCQLSNRYQGYDMPLTFVVERKHGRRWKGYGSLVPGGDQDFSMDEGAIAYAKLPKGTFRIRIRFQDAAHATPIYSRWHTVMSR